MNHKKVPSVSGLYAQISKNSLSKATLFTDELWYSRLFGRKISIYFSWIFLTAGYHPNVATFTAIFLSVFGAALMSFGTPLMFVLGFIFFHLYIIMDSSDGEMARFYGIKDERGAFLDKMMHFVAKSALFVSLGFIEYHFSGNVWMIVLAVFVALVSLLASAYFHLLPTNQNVSYSDQTKTSGELIARARKLFRMVTGEIELSILLMGLYAAHFLLLLPLTLTIPLLLIGELALFLLFLVYQTFVLLK